MTTINAKALLTVFVMVGLHTSVYGAEPSKSNGGHLGWVVNAAAEYGGDEVARVYYTNNTDQAVKAGQGLGLGVGGHYRFVDSGFDLSATVGFKYVTTQASNADIHLNRTVIEALGSYIFNNNAWLSAGPVLHQNIKFAAGGLAPSVGFDNSSGFTVKAGWKVIGLSYTNIEYQDTGKFKNKYDASNFGLVLIGRF